MRWRRAMTNHIIRLAVHSAKMAIRLTADNCQSALTCSLQQAAQRSAKLVVSSLVSEEWVGVVEVMHSCRSGVQAARQARLRAWTCQSILCPPASFQLTQDRGIKLFEVAKAVALNPNCTASSPDIHDKKLLSKWHAVLQIFSKEARVERRRKLKVHS